MEHYWFDALKFTGKPNTGVTYFIGYVFGLFVPFGVFSN